MLLTDGVVSLGPPRDEDAPAVAAAVQASLDAANGCVELGYWIGQDHTGHGYATRSARLAIGHAFGDLGMHRVEVCVAVSNVRSQRVAERLGAGLEGRLVDRILTRGEWHDAFLYAVIA